MKSHFTNTVLALSFVLLCAAVYAQDPVVNIPDANFKAALVSDSTINSNRDSEIQVSEAQAYTGSIIVPARNIADLTGIEAFTALTGLDCSSNQLITLNMSANTLLTSIVCSRNALTSLIIKNGITIKSPATLLIRDIIQICIALMSMMYTMRRSPGTTPTTK